MNSEIIKCGFRHLGTLYLLIDILGIPVRRLV